MDFRNRKSNIANTSAYKILGSIIAFFDFDSASIMDSLFSMLLNRFCVFISFLMSSIVFELLIVLIVVSSHFE